MLNLESLKLGIIGLGYVGLPLAVSFSKQCEVVGFDINARRINELKNGFDASMEVEPKLLEEARNRIKITSDEIDLKDCNIYIVTVPTPISFNNKPDLSFLLSACELIGNYLKMNDIVIFESTVFPGCTEDVCVPLLEKTSGLKFNKDFSCGYSPERINPGDRERTLEKIVKITSGSNSITANIVDSLYGLIISAGTVKVATIKTAEAAKVIENTQRDLNIALINELAQLFNKLGLDTEEVLKAAETKWNFQSFRPGLVGGHCIGVDPYYLTHIAEKNCFNPKVILAGRDVNDGMSTYVKDRICDELMQRGKSLKDTKVLCLGLTFKENCPDIRNSKVFDVIKALETTGIEVDSYDPFADNNEVSKEYNISPLEKWPSGHYDAILVSVAHDVFIEDYHRIVSLLSSNQGFIFDLKFMAPESEINVRL